MHFTSSGGFSTFPSGRLSNARGTLAVGRVFPVAMASHARAFLLPDTRFSKRHGGHSRKTGCSSSCKVEHHAFLRRLLVLLRIALSHFALVPAGQRGVPLNGEPFVLVADAGPVFDRAECSLVLPCRTSGERDSARVRFCAKVELSLGGSGGNYGRRFSGARLSETRAVVPARKAAFSGGLRRWRYERAPLSRPRSLARVAPAPR